VQRSEAASKKRKLGPLLVVPMCHGNFQVPKRIRLFHAFLQVEVEIVLEVEAQKGGGDQHVCAGGQLMADLFITALQSRNGQEKCWKMAAIAAMVMVKLPCDFIFFGVVN